MSFSQESKKINKRNLHTGLEVRMHTEALCTTLHNISSAAEYLSAFAGAL